MSLREVNKDLDKTASFTKEPDQSMESPDYHNENNPAYLTVH